MQKFATKAFIKANPNIFPEGIEGNRKLVQEGIENVTFFPNKGTGGSNIGVKGIKFKSPEAFSLSGKKLGTAGTVIDVGLLVVDFTLDLEEGSRTGDYMNDHFKSGVRGSVVLGASIFIHPIIGPIVALHDITMAKDGKRIYRNLAAEAKRDYLKYRNSNNRKADRALERYKAFGGQECLNCMPTNVSFNQGR